MQNQRWNLGLALLFFAASATTLIWWIPNDIETGLVVSDRYSTSIGDALAPTVVAFAILIVSLTEGLVALFSRRTENLGVHEPKIGLTRENLASLGVFALIIVVSLGLMLWLGPLTISMLQSLGFEFKPYRLLADTVPYKYIGFSAGGFVLVLSLIGWIEGRVSKMALLVATIAVVVLIIAYDLPFDSLFLPPNGSL